MPLLTIPKIEQRLKAHEALIPFVSESTRQAAVAVILREGTSGTEALFIRRAERPGDIWSGNMAFPGGHREAQDQDLQATAVRETREEIGLDLNVHARLLGHLDYIDVNPIGTTLQMIVAPYVYALTGVTPELSPNHEVADVLWGSMRDMYYGESRTSRDFHVRGETRTFAGYGIEDQIVWGLTYRMLGQFFSILNPEWQQ
ncbi:MAG: CoA pyrophosphatase [Gammaproteobacteria bacterium]|nr:CoA pyrophosphatase [Gammaproteobacteria bacterium]